MFENTSKCEDCLYYEYDDEYGFYVCDMDLDEDETAQFIGVGCLLFKSLVIT